MKPTSVAGYLVCWNTGPLLDERSPVILCVFVIKGGTITKRAVGMVGCHGLSNSVVKGETNYKFPKMGSYGFKS